MTQGQSRFGVKVVREPNSLRGQRGSGLREGQGSKSFRGRVDQGSESFGSNRGLRVREVQE